MLFLSRYDFKTRYLIPYNKNFIPDDVSAYKKYPHFNFVYDKYFVIKSQGVKCGTMDIKPIVYPVFVKPKINLIGGNRGCFVVNNEAEFIDVRNKYEKVKETDNIKSLFWSSFIEGQEGSTDFIVENGIIRFEIDYKINKISGSIIGVETIISTKNKTPNKVRQWIYRYMGDYTGIVNLQYIGDTIIEVGLRPDAGGRFIQWTNNKELVKNINYFIETGKWIEQTNQTLDFKDVYVIGCYKDYPIIYYIPYPIIVLLMKNNKIQNWHYYIDVQKKGKKYLNIVDNDREKLIRVKNLIENIMYIMNLFFIVFIFAIGFYILTTFLLKNKINKKLYYIILAVFILYLTRFINPTTYVYNKEY